MKKLLLLLSLSGSCSLLQAQQGFSAEMNAGPAFTIPHQTALSIRSVPGPAASLRFRYTFRNGFFLATSALIDRKKQEYRMAVTDYTGMITWDGILKLKNDYFGIALHPGIAFGKKIRFQLDAGPCLSWHYRQQMQLTRTGAPFEPMDLKMERKIPGWTAGIGTLYPVSGRCSLSLRLRYDQSLWIDSPYRSGWLRFNQHTFLLLAGLDVLLAPVKKQVNSQ